MNIANPKPTLEPAASPQPQAKGKKIKSRDVRYVRAAEMVHKKVLPLLSEESDQRRKAKELADELIDEAAKYKKQHLSQSQ